MKPIITSIYILGQLLSLYSKVVIHDFSALTAPGASAKQYFALRSVPELAPVAPWVHRNLCGALTIAALSGDAPVDLLVDLVDEEAYAGFLRGSGLTTTRMLDLADRHNLRPRIIPYADVCGSEECSFDRYLLGAGAVILAVGINKQGEIVSDGKITHWVALIGFQEDEAVVYNPFNNQREHVARSILLSSWRGDHEIPGVAIHVTVPRR